MESSSSTELERAKSFLMKLRRAYDRFPEFSAAQIPQSPKLQLSRLRDLYGTQLDQMLSQEAMKKIHDGDDNTEHQPVVSDDVWGAFLSQLLDEIEVSGLSNPQAKAANVLWASLRTGDFNGMAVAVPKSEYKLILIDDGLFGFANLACKALCRAFRFKGTDDGSIKFSTDTEDIRSEVAENAEISERMLDFLTAYLVLGHPHFARPYLIDATRLSLVNLVRHGLELFVLAHEYGHCIAGHLDNPKYIRRALPQADSNYDAIAISHKQEYEADLIGCVITLNVMVNKGYDIALSYLGVEAFFVCVDLIGRTQSMLQFGKVTETLSSATHPSPGDRRKSLRHALNELVGQVPADDAIQLAECFQVAAEQCWSQCAPAFLSLHNKGLRPAPQWAV